MKLFQKSTFLSTINQNLKEPCGGISERGDQNVSREKDFDATLWGTQDGSDKFIATKKLFCKTHRLTKNQFHKNQNQTCEKNKKSPIIKKRTGHHHPSTTHIFHKIDSTSTTHIFHKINTDRGYGPVAI